MDVSSRWTKMPLRSVGQPAEWGPFARALAAVLLCLLCASALLLLARRCAGALAEPLPPGLLIFVGLCIAAAVAATRVLSSSWQWSASLPAASWHQAFRWGPTLAVAMFAAALAIEGTSLPGLAIYLAVIVGAEFFSGLVAERGTALFKSPGNDCHGAPSVGQAFRTKKIETATVAEKSASTLAVETADWDAATELEVDVEADSALDELPEAMLAGAWQQVTRARTAEGEVVTGWVKTEFQPGERTAVLHVAFCPPLQAAPEVELEQLSGPAARLKAAQVLPQGARLEIRLSTPASRPESLMLAFVASEPAAE